VLHGELRQEPLHSPRVELSTALPWTNSWLPFNGPPTVTSRPPSGCCRRTCNWLGSAGPRPAASPPARHRPSLGPGDSQAGPRSPQFPRVPSKVRPHAPLCGGSAHLDRHPARYPAEQNWACPRTPTSQPRLTRRHLIPGPRDYIHGDRPTLQRVAQPVLAARSAHPVLLPISADFRPCGPGPASSPARPQPVPDPLPWPALLPACPAPTSGLPGATAALFHPTPVRPGPAPFCDQ
jgi:hypothetical protein